MTKVKGTAVAASVEYLKVKLGPEGFARLVEGLPEAERTLFSSPVLEGAWYEFGALTTLMRAASGKVGLPSGRTLAWDMGRFSAERAFGTVYRMFFRFADIAFICKRAASLYPALYDSGEMRLVASDAKTATIRVSGFAEPCPEFCDRALGWIERTLEMTGAKHVRVDHPVCAARGDAHCDYRGSWD